MWIRIARLIERENALRRQGREHHLEGFPEYHVEVFGIVFRSRRIREPFVLKSVLLPLALRFPLHH